MDIFDLYAKISLDTKSYTTGISSAKASFDGFKTHLGDALKTVAKITAAATAAVTGVSIAMGKKLVSDAKSLAEYGDHIDKMSQKMGMSAKAYQEWDAVLQHSGTSIDVMKASMKTLANAAQNNNKAFKQLGITEKDLKTLSQEDLFAKTIEGLQKVTDTTQRTYLAGQLLGRGATELGALLNTSAEETQKMKDKVHQLGGVMSDESVKAAAKFQDNLQDLKTAISGVKRGIINDTLPAFNDLMEGFTKLASGEEDAEKDIDRGVEKLEKAILDISPKIKTISEKLLPSVVIVGSRLVTEVAKTLPEFIGEIAPVLFNSGVEIVTSIGKGIFDQLDKSNFDETAGKLTEKVNEIIDGVDTEKSSEKFASVMNKIINAVFNVTSTFDFKNTAEKMSSWLNNAINKIDWAKLGQTVSDLFEGVWDFIGTALDEIDWENVGEKIGEFVSNIKWGEILTSIFKAIGGVLKAMPSLLKGLVESLDFESAAGLAAFIFAPKLGKKLLNAFKTDPDTKKSLGESGEEVSKQVGDKVDGKGVGTKFATTFKAGLEAFAVGWEIGTWLYNTLKDDFDWAGKELGSTAADAIRAKIQGTIDATTEKTNKMLANKWNAIIGRNVVGAYDFGESETWKKKVRAAGYDPETGEVIKKTKSGTLKQLSEIKKAGLGWLNLTSNDINKRTEAYTKASDAIDFAKKYGGTASQYIYDVNLYEKAKAGKLKTVWEKSINLQSGGGSTGKQTGSSGFDASQYQAKTTPQSTPQSADAGIVWNTVNSDIYLDTGKLVGGTQNAYSHATAQQQNFTARGLAT